MSFVRKPGLGLSQVHQPDIGISTLCRFASKRPSSDELDRAAPRREKLHLDALVQHVIDSPSPLLGLVTSIIVANAQRTAPARQPASRAAAILTWSPARRERYIAALDSMFLTRTVRASSRPHVLERGSPLPRVRDRRSAALRRPVHGVSASPWPPRAAERQSSA